MTCGGVNYDVLFIFYFFDEYPLTLH